MSDIETNDVSSNAGDFARRAIAGLFYGTVQAEIALTELKAAGYRDAELSEVAGDRNESSVTEPRRTAGTTFFREHETRASAFASELSALEFSDADAEDLVASIVRGKTVVTVDTAPLGSGAAEGIFERHNATIYYSRSVVRAFPPAGSQAEELSLDGRDFDGGDLDGLDLDGRDRPEASAKPSVTQERVLELREERLVVEKQQVAYAETTVSKRVVTEMQTVEVPVTREELVIERVPVSGESAVSSIEAGEPGEQIVIPLSREVVSVEKRVVPIADVTVGVRRVEGVQHVEEQVRREELVVENQPEREP